MNKIEAIGEQKDHIDHNGLHNSGRKCSSLNSEAFCPSRQNVKHYLLHNSVKRNNYMSYDNLVTFTTYLKEILLRTSRQ